MSYSIEMTTLLFYFDSFNEQVIIHGWEFEPNLEDASALLLISAFFLHFGILKPSLIGKRLEVGYQFKKYLRLIKFTFSFCEIGKIK